MNDQGDRIEALKIAAMVSVGLRELLSNAALVLNFIQDREKVVISPEPIDYGTTAEFLIPAGMDPEVAKLAIERTIKRLKNG